MTNEILNFVFGGAAVNIKNHCRDLIRIGNQYDQLDCLKLTWNPFGTEYFAAVK